MVHLYKTFFGHKNTIITLCLPALLDVGPCDFSLSLNEIQVEGLLF